MKRLLYFGSCLALFMSAAVAANAQCDNLQKRAASGSKLTAFLKVNFVYGSSDNLSFASIHGTGSFIKPDGIIMTAAHVLSPIIETKNILGYNVEIFYENKVYDASLIGVDSYTGIGLVRIDKPDRKFPTVKLRNSTKLRLGDCIYTIGSPDIYQGLFRTGIVNGFEYNDYQQAYLITNMYIGHGDSGGPVFDKNGRVIGLDENISVSYDKDRMIVSEFGSPSFDVLVDDLTLRSVQTLAIGATLVYPQFSAPHLQSVYDVHRMLSDDSYLILKTKFKIPADSNNGVVLLQTAEPQFQEGDIVLRINNVAVNTNYEFWHAIRSSQPGSIVRFDVLRHGQPVIIAKELTIASIKPLQ